MQLPEFCPNPRCLYHYHDVTPVPRSLGPPGGRWYARKGGYYTQVRGRVQRFRCRCCGTGFSEQTFSIDYYAKRIIPYEQLDEKNGSTGSLRDNARAFGISPATVSNKLSRLARQAIAAHNRCVSELKPDEPLATDGFESFTYSQYFPNNYNLLLGATSQFLIGATYCTIRRKGRMTVFQKRKRAALEDLYRPASGALYHSFHSLLDEAVPVVARYAGTPPQEIRSDEKREYRLALQRHPFYAPLLASGKLRHRRVSSRVARRRSNPLFAVNYFDRELRKDMANHVRETVCFARNVNSAMERFWIYAVRHNTVKRYRERQPRKDNSTHASVAGIPERIVRSAREHYYTRRAFFSRQKHLPASQILLWRRQLETPLHPNGNFTLPRYAVA